MTPESRNAASLADRHNLLVPQKLTFHSQARYFIRICLLVPSIPVVQWKTPAVQWHLPRESRKPSTANVPGQQKNWESQSDRCSPRAWNPATLIAVFVCHEMLIYELRQRNSLLFTSDCAIRDEVDLKSGSLNSHIQLQVYIFTGRWHFITRELHQARPKPRRILGLSVNLMASLLSTWSRTSVHRLERIKGNLDDDNMILESMWLVSSFRLKNKTRKRRLKEVTRYKSRFFFLNRICKLQSLFDGQQKCRKTVRHSFGRHFIFLWTVFHLLSK